MNSPSVKSHATFSAAISLLEMLVGMAIMAIIAAVAIPVYQTAVEKMHVAKCLHNLRQMGVGFQLYANDNDGYLPRTETLRKRVSDPPRTNGTLVWPYLIAEYVNVSDFATTYQTPSLFRHSVFACPSEWDYEKNNGNYNIHYSINRQLNENLFPDGKAWIKQTAIRSPSKWMVLSDSYHSWHIYTDSQKKMKEWSGLTRRHGGIPNFLYADGHVEPFKREILGLGDPGGQDPFYRSLWEYNY